MFCCIYNHFHLKYLPIFNYHFSPHAWIEYTWNPLTSLERWLSVVGIIFFFLVAELNTFYLKFVLWFPPEHWLNFVRLALVLCWGAVGLRETFQFLGKNNIQYNSYFIYIFFTSRHLMTFLQYFYRRSRMG